MATNIERYKKDIERLSEIATKLRLAMYLEADPEAFRKRIEKGKTKEEAKKFLDNLPKNFNVLYEGWYSESLAVIKQLLPDRIQDFISLYERSKNRKSLSYDTYVMRDYLQGLIQQNNFGETIVPKSAAIPIFEQQSNILEAASRRLESSLFEIQDLVRADLFDSELDAARELLKKNFVRAAGAIAGVLIEKHLQQVCANHKIPITKKNPTINDLNELLRNGHAIEQHQWREITFLADIRNLCDHNKEKEPTKNQVNDLLDGTNKIMKTIH